MISRERALGIAAFVAVVLLAIVAAVLALAALPLVLVAFPMTIAAVVIVLFVGWIRHRRRGRG